MTAEKCPSCGAGISLAIPSCLYCGTLLSQTDISGWNLLSKVLPPKSADPGRSIPVIVLNLPDGLTKKNIKTGEMTNIYDTVLSIDVPCFLMSAYYDYHKKTWANDILGKRRGKIPATHWMPIPPAGSPVWIPVDRQLPALGKNFSKYVIACDQSYSFPQSIIIAKRLVDDQEWWADDLVETGDEGYEIPVTHWMPIPPGPKE